MAQIDVVQLHAPGYEHLRAFDEVAESLIEGLERAGHRSVARHGELGPGRNIVLGSHLLGPEQIDGLKSGTILYNFEQIGPTSMLPPERLSDFAGYDVWDYSHKNIDEWAAAGIEARLVPVGWSPKLARLDRADAPSTDVVFYGSLNDRRRAVLDALESRGLTVATLFGVFGADRDAAIADAKVAVNIHFYESGILEIVRLSFLFANAVPVVSERAPNTEVPNGFDDAAVFAPYDSLVDEVVALVGDADRQAAVGARGRQRMEAVPWESVIPADLGTPSPPRPTTPRRPPARQPAKKAAMTNSAVLVLGCHRSGTSMLTRLVNLGGYGITGPVIPAAADNPTGFWEDQRIALIDDQLMAVSGTRWDAYTAPGIVNWRTDPRLVALRQQLVDHLGQTTHERVVIKDPRITLLYPFWQELLSELGWDVTVVFAVRNPLDVAESLRTRNGFSPIKGTLLWLTYTLIGEAFTRGTSRLVLDYDAMLQTPEDGVSLLQQALDFSGSIEEIRAYAADTIDPSLHRSVANRNDYGFRAATMAGAAHQALLRGDLDALDGLTAQYLDALELFMPLVTGLRGAVDDATAAFG